MGSAERVLYHVKFVGKATSWEVSREAWCHGEWGMHGPQENVD